MIRPAWWATLVGLCGLVGVAIVAAFDLRAALAGWLFAFVLVSAVPLGSLVLVLIARLTPGPWRDEVSVPGEAMLLALPVLPLALLPVLIGAGALYPWAWAPRSYLGVWFFAARSLVLLAIVAALGILLLLRPAWSRPLAAGGLIFYVMAEMVLAVDWLMSLDPEFHSSGFSLYVLSIQVSVALSVIALWRLIVPGEPPDPSMLGRLMLTTLLLWAYLSFMQYVISWSENLPKPVAWFAHRGTGAWVLVEYAIGALDLAPMFLLMLKPIRRSRHMLVGIALAVLAGKALEIAWLIFPDASASTLTGAGAGGLSLLALAGLGAGGMGVFGRGAAGWPPILAARGVANGEPAGERVR